jgi:sugar lactone lactonase YvrE
MPRLPLALTLTVALAAGCGPVKIDVGGVVVTGSPKPSKSPGESPSPEPTGTSLPVVTPTPDGTVAPNQTPTPNNQQGGSPTPTPEGATPQPTPTPGPGGATPTPAPAGNASIKSFALAGPNKPMGVGVDGQGNAWVGMGQFSSSTVEPATLMKLGPDGKPIKSVELPGAIACVVVDKADNAWALHLAKSQFGSGTVGAISKVSSSGELLSTQVLGGAISQPGLLTLDPAGNLWTLEQMGKLDKISPNGGLLGSYATGSGSAGGQPYGVGAGADGTAWVALGSAEKPLLHFGTTGTLMDGYKPTSSSSLYSLGVDSAGGVWAGGPTSSGTSGGSTITYFGPTGKELGHFEVGAYIRTFLPAADAQMWVLTATQAGGGSVTRMKSNGEALDSYPAGDAPQNFGIGGDGSIWVTNPNAGKVTRIMAAHP